MAASLKGGRLGRISGAARSVGIVDSIGWKISGAFGATWRMAKELPSSNRQDHYGSGLVRGMPERRFGWRSEGDSLESPNQTAMRGQSSLFIPRGVRQSRSPQPRTGKW